MTSDRQFIAVIAAIRSGDLEALQRLLTDDPSIAASRLGGIANGRTPLHVVSDWPGFFPNGSRIARLLIDTGAEVNVRSDGDHGETPLHWAASSDDADVAAVLIDCGADIETQGGSIGTPLDNAIGYNCWNVARLLVARGARVDALWHAAALGLSSRLEELLSDETLATPENVSQAFWHACAGGQRRTAELLFDRGADLNWQPDYATGTALDAANAHGTGQDNLIRWLTAQGAIASESK
ncbi:ankyrin repeat domain-containing protein [Rathayibacter soli]|uniref:ankyrin repeat domain-containing protein n=1 Tax=Rathayibacter soli TaxID=3144168 RepID=UPI0027E47AA5|nr:ankyrin repeat domain-containing protein [Glaciibacter superstes]